MKVTAPGSPGATNTLKKPDTVKSTPDALCRRFNKQSIANGIIDETASGSST